MNSTLTVHDTLKVVEFIATTLLRVGGVGTKRDRRERINIEVVTIYLPNDAVSMVIFTGLLRLWYNDLLNIDIVIVYSPGIDGEVHLKLSPTLSILSGFNIIKVFSLTGSIITCPFILPLVKVFPFNDHTVSEGNGSLPLNPHLKQRVLINGSTNASSLPKKNCILLWGHCCPSTSPTIIVY